jgi:hypothetical protein
VSGRCDLTELLTEDCAHCRPSDDLPGDDPRIVAVWTARYDWYDWCDWCDDRIAPGDRIGRDEHGSYVCGRCLP